MQEVSCRYYGVFLQECQFQVYTYISSTHITIWFPVRLDAVRMNFDDVKRKEKKNKKHIDAFKHAGIIAVSHNIQLIFIFLF